MQTMPDEKALQARARVIEAYEAIELISRHRHHLRQILANHDPNTGDNATRRDCAAFEAGLRDLGLLELAKRLAEAHDR
jgi:hypothetical protein